MGTDGPGVCPDPFIDFQICRCVCSCGIFTPDVCGWGGMLSVIFHLFRRKQVTSWHHLWDQMIQYLSKHFKYFFPTDFDHIVRHLNIREMSIINVLNGSIQLEGMNFKQPVSLKSFKLSDTVSASVLGCI